MPSGYLYVMTTEHVDARPALASALVTAIDHVASRCRTSTQRPSGTTITSA